ncbi:MAG: PepSY-like domain-containing protein [Flavisolibacter sp.]
MKFKLMSLVAATVLFFSCGTTYKSTSSNAAYGLPSNIRTNFTAMYPDATNVTYTHFDATAAPVDWELNGWNALDTTASAVNFDMGGRKYTAWYDAKGTWVGTAYALNYTMLPPAVGTLLQQKYDGYNVESVQKETWKDQTAYEIKLKNDTGKLKLLVDPGGNVLKQKTE